MTVMEVMSLFVDPPPVTAKVAVPVATVWSALVYVAVMVADPGPVAVTTPVEGTTVAISVLLEAHTTPVTFTLAPATVTPTAEKVAVSPGAATV